MKTIAKFALPLLALALLAPGRASGERHANDDLLTALAEAPLGIVYGDDGAADGTVTSVPTDDALREDAPAQVRAILDLGPTCIPLMIDHLDDRRPTNAMFQRGQHRRTPIRVPLGHVCLDILLSVTAGRAVHIEDCADDGLGAGVHSGYYFRPDVLYQSHGARTMRQVKAQWQRAYRTKQIRFVYPAWLKRG